ncbi:MAG: TonB-dependent receptor [Smithellaceae bacterium]|nr:TonB-dependent receptor [Smithellaceae bacterium]
MKPFLLFLLLLSFFSVAPAQASSVKDEEPVTLEEVVVTATRDAQEIRKTPANATVITASDIEKTGATTVVEVLDRLEGIQFHTFSGNSSQAYIDMRGTGGDNPFGKTLVMLDGRRLNRTDMASINWLQTPVNMIERIEVIRGPGSVLYGDAAIGGVINIISKKGKGKPVANASVLAGSYGLHNERIGVTGAAGAWTYALVGENNFSSGYRDRSRYAAQGGGFDVGYAAHDLLNVSLGVSFNRADYQMPGALTKDQMRQDRRQYQPAMPAYFMNANDDNDGRDRYTNVNLGVKSFWGRLGQMDIHFLYGRKDLETNMPSWASSWSPYSYVYSDTSAETYGIAPKYVLERNIRSFRNKVTAGIDYYQEPYQKIFFNDRERTLRLSRAKLMRESAGAYIRDEFSPFKNLVVSAGYRFEETAVSGSNTDFAAPTNDFDNRKTYRAQAYEAGITWLWGQKSKAYARYATVYRIPFLDEIASFNGYGAPSPFLVGLDKEKGKSFEIGSEYFPLKNLKLAVTLYRLDMEDEIQYFIYDPILYLGENRNVGKTRHDGAEISVSYLWEKTLRVYGNFTYAKATFEAGQFNKKEIPMVPNRLMHAGVEIFLPHAVTLRTEVRHTGDAYLSGDNDNNTEKLEAYTLLNAYLFYKPAFGRLQMTVFAAVENLTDTQYCSFGLDYAQYGMPNFYYPMPGRTFKGGLSFEF